MAGPSAILDTGDNDGAFVTGRSIIVPWLSAVSGNTDNSDRGSITGIAIVLARLSAISDTGNNDGAVVTDVAVTIAVVAITAIIITSRRRRAELGLLMDPLLDEPFPNADGIPNLIRISEVPPPAHDLAGQSP